MPGPTGTCGIVQAYIVVGSTVILYRKYTRALSFENVGAAGVVEALVQLGRFDQALLYADYFLFDCGDDIRDLLSAHKAILQDCKWVEELERAHSDGRSRREGERERELGDATLAQDVAQVC